MVRAFLYLAAVAALTVPPQLARSEATALQQLTTNDGKAVRNAEVWKTGTPNRLTGGFSAAVKSSRTVDTESGPGWGWVLSGTLLGGLVGLVVGVALGTLLGRPRPSVAPGSPKPRAWHSPSPGAPPPAPKPPDTSPETPQPPVAPAPTPGKKWAREE